MKQQKVMFSLKTSTVDGVTRELRTDDDDKGILRYSGVDAWEPNTELIERSLGAQRAGSPRKVIHRLWLLMKGYNKEFVDSALNEIYRSEPCRCLDCEESEWFDIRVPLFAIWLALTIGGIFI